MNTQVAAPNPVHTTAPDIFRDAIAHAVVGREVTTARRIRGEARQFLAWAIANDVDPLHPSRADIHRYLEGFGDTIAHQRDWKIGFAIRSVLNAAGIPPAEHGLGTGDRSSILGDIQDPGLRDVVDAFLAGVEKRPAVVRSGLAKLLTWAAEYEADPLALSGPDLDDYADWIRRVGGSIGELLVIARKFAAFSTQPSTRRLISRAQRGAAA